MRLITVLLLALLASGCGKSVPDNAEIEALLRDHVLSDGLGDLFALDAFNRTNGFRESDNVYIVDVEYDLVFQKS